MVLLPRLPGSRNRKSGVDTGPFLTQEEARGEEEGSPVFHHSTSAACPSHLCAVMNVVRSTDDVDADADAVVSPTAAVAVMVYSCSNIPCARHVRRRVCGKAQTTAVAMRIVARAPCYWAAGQVGGQRPRRRRDLGVLVGRQHDGHVEVRRVSHE